MKIDVTDNNTYFVIPDFIVKKYKLRRLDHEVFGKVLSLSLKNGCCFASNSFIGNSLLSNKDTISKCVGRLEQVGLVINQLKYDKTQTQVTTRYLVPNMDNKDVYDFVTKYYKDFNIANFEKKFKSFRDYVYFLKSCTSTEEASIKLQKLYRNETGVDQMDYRYRSNGLGGIDQMTYGCSSNGLEGIDQMVVYNNKENNKVSNKEISKDNNNVCSENKIQLSIEERNLLYKDYPEALVSKKINEYEIWKEKIKPRNIKSDYVEIRKWIDKAKTNCNESLVKQCKVDEVTDEDLQNINF